MTDIQALSNEHSINAYFNSFLQEWNFWRLNDNRIIIPLLNEDRALILTVKHLSVLGRHKFSPQIVLKNHQDLSDISLGEASKCIYEILNKTYPNIRFEFKKFHQRLENSIENICYFIGARPDLKENYWNNIAFLKSEQALILGHNLHPTPKSRDNLGFRDMFKYAPELTGSFKFSWYLIDKNILYSESSETMQKTGLTFPTQTLFHSETENAKWITDKILFPIHPIQENLLRKKTWFKNYLRTKRMTKAEEDSGIWSPTSSLRAVYNENAHYMIKTSLDIRLTNSLRLLNIKEAKRGLIFQDVMGSKKLKNFHENNSCFEILHEPSFGAIKDSDDQPDEQSLIILRENPFRSFNPKQICMLATLTQSHPYGGRSLLLQQIDRISLSKSLSYRDAAHQWFESFLTTSILPLIELACEYGIFGSSHQQNMLIEFEDDLPVKSYFRDCQGTAYLKSNLPDLIADTEINSNDCLVFKDDTTFHLFGYYYFFNSCFSVISTIATEHKIKEESLIIQMKNFLKMLKVKNYRDNRFIDHFLTSDVLMTKSNFLCSTYNIQESSMKNPLDIYIETANPFLNLKKEDQACNF